MLTIASTPKLFIFYIFNDLRILLHFLGYYYQVELRGETITWLVSHEFAQEHNEDVDYKVRGMVIKQIDR